MYIHVYIHIYIYSRSVLKLWFEYLWWYACILRGIPDVFFKINCCTALSVKESKKHGYICHHLLSLNFRNSKL